MLIILFIQRYILLKSEEFHIDHKEVLNAT